MKITNRLIHIGTI